MNSKKLIKFYGSEFPEMFAIERKCMDRDRQIIRYLKEELPDGTILDVGAGDGFTAEILNHGKREIVALEPDQGMIDPQRKLAWVRGYVQELPFVNGSFDAGYATWAYFLSFLNKNEGLNELDRVVKKDGRLILVDNAGGDDFMSLSNQPYDSDLSWWMEQGFKSNLIESSFRFDSTDEAKLLLSFYFGDLPAESVKKTEYSFNVFAHTRASSGKEQ